MDKKETKVIFRMFGDGQVIAMFPEVAADRIGKYCDSYMHVGQHSAASPKLVTTTTLASKEDYKDLFDELTKMGYNLKVVKYFSYTMQKKRMVTYV